MSEEKKQKDIAIVYDLSILQSPIIVDELKQEDHVTKIIHVSAIQDLISHSHPNAVTIINLVNSNPSLIIDNSISVYSEKFPSDLILEYCILKRISNAFENVYIRSINDMDIIRYLKYGFTVLSSKNVVKDSYSEATGMCSILDRAFSHLASSTFVFDTSACVAYKNEKDNNSRLYAKTFIFENSIPKIILSCVLEELQHILDCDKFLDIVNAIQKTENNVKLILTEEGYKKNYTTNDKIILFNSLLLKNSINSDLTIFTKDREFAYQSTIFGMETIFFDGNVYRKKVSDVLTTISKNNDPAHQEIPDENTSDSEIISKSDDILKDNLPPDNKTAKPTEGEVLDIDAIEPNISLTSSNNSESKEDINEDSTDVVTDFINNDPKNEARIKLKFHGGVWICAKNSADVFYPLSTTEDNTLPDTIDTIRHCKKVYYNNVKPGQLISPIGSNKLYKIISISPILTMDNLKLIGKIIE